MLLHEKIIVTNDDYKNRINELTKDIKEYRSTKRKIVFRSGLCLCTWLGIAGASLLAIPAITTGIAISVGKSPFKRDEKRTYAHVRTEFDTVTGEKTSKQYEKYEDETNTLSYHSGWVENNGQYSSTLITYYVEDLTYDEINSCIRGEKELDKKTSEEYIIKEEITAEELAKGPYYSGVAYEIDKNDYLYSKQTSSENFSDVLSSIIIPFVLSSRIAVFAVNVLPEDKNDMFGEEFNPDRAFGHYDWINDDLKNAKATKKHLLMELKKNSD